MYVFFATNLLNDIAIQAAMLNQLAIQIPPSVFELAVAALVLVSITIVVGALLARPLLRTPGWWIGLATTALAIATLPLSIITFPTGLAAWILLTDETGRGLFRTRSSKLPLAETAQT